MANKKLFTDYTEVTANQLTDQVPVLQSGNKKTTLQKVYNLFKAGFDLVYATIAQVNAKMDKQDLTIININASITSPCGISSGVFSITNITGGSGEKHIRINCENVLSQNDFLLLTVKYDGTDIDLRSYAISNAGILSLWINVHSNPTEPVLISFKKIN